MDVPIYFEGLYHDGNSNFAKIFEKENHFKDKTIKILHLGAYSGHGTKWMLERVSGSCIDVDLWRRPLENDSSISDKYYKEFYNDTNVESLYDQTVDGLPTTKFKGTTKEFFAQNKETFDFIYIDASHKKSDVAADLNESFKLLNVNGIIACDDYLWNVENLTISRDLIPHEAINEFIENHKEKIEILANNYQLWFKKISE
jgi:predicted O-methyltransferase YrrM